MSKKIFGDVEPKCAYCEYGQRTPDGSRILCVKKGIFDLNYSCKKFRFDPLKKVPGPAPELPEFSPEDFEL